jgi:hypothetical protein
MTTAVSSSQPTAYQAPLGDASEVTTAQAPKDDFGLSDIAASLAEIESTSSSVTPQERPVLNCIATLLLAISRLIATFKNMPTNDDSSDIDSNDSPIDANTDLTAAPESGSTDAVDSSSETATDTEAPSSGSATDKTETPEKTGPEVTTPENTKVETGTLLGKTGDFLWKPESDKDHKLAVLLPKGLTGKIKSVSILSPDKKKILQTGKYSGVGNGGREHFRFTKAGSAFPDGAIVLIKLNDGTSKYVTIKETSARTTR